jgi:sugar lactone lactonase YvrE
VKMKTPNRRRPALLAVQLVVLALLAALFLAPSPIHAAAWTPDAGPAWAGVLSTNRELLQVGLLGETKLTHPEDVAFDVQGRLYAGCEDGNIYRLALDASGRADQISVFARIGGYPLGLAFDKAGELIVADKGVGLLSVDPNGKATILTNQVGGTPITYANDLDIAQDGTIYFSDSSTRFNRGWPYDILEAKPYGRLLAYDPANASTRLIKDGLYFANGIALSHDESYLLVGETARYRIARLYLKGPKSGSWDYFAENLPLLVDNIDRDGNGGYFVAGNRRLPFIDKLQPNPFLKDQVAKLPSPFLVAIPALKPNRYGFLLQLDSSGSMQRSLQDPTGRVYATSSATPYQGSLYIGTLYGDAIAQFKLSHP